MPILLQFTLGINFDVSKHKLQMRCFGNVKDKEPIGYLFHYILQQHPRKSNID